MNESDNKSTGRLLAYFLLALLFALLTIVVQRPRQIFQSGFGFGIIVDTRWMFWVLLILAALCVFPLIAAALKVLHRKNVLPPFLDFMAIARFDENIQRLVSRARAILFGAIGLTVITGGAILLLAVYLHQTRALDDDAVNGNLYDLARQFRGVKNAPQKFSKVTKVLYLTPDEDAEHQLRDCLEIVKKLKAAGAKAVLISLPNFSMTITKHLKLMSEIESNGIVVWGVPMSGMSRVNLSQLRDSTGMLGIYPASYLSETEDMWRGSSVSRVRLSSGNIVRTVGGEVTIMLMQKCLNIPHYQHGTVTDDALHLDSLMIPLSQQGWMYSLDRYAGSFWPDLYVHRGQQWTIGRSFWMSPAFHAQDVTTYFGSTKDLDTLRYSLRLQGEGFSTSHEPIDQQTLEERVKDRIVFLVSNYGMTAGSYLPDRAYAVGLENILRGNIARKPDSGYAWFSLICLIVAGFVALRLRALVAILLMFLLALCALWFGSYLYESQNVLIDMFYPLLSIGIGMIVFPALVLARKMGYENAQQ
jgi:hypothetical protein